MLFDEQAELENEFLSLGSEHVFVCFCESIVDLDILDLEKPLLKTTIVVSFVENILFSNRKKERTCFIEDENTFKEPSRIKVMLENRDFSLFIGIPVKR